MRCGTGTFETEEAKDEFVKSAPEGYRVRIHSIKTRDTGKTIYRVQIYRRFNVYGDIERRIKDLERRIISQRKAIERIQNHLKIK